jgi:hypothetical protein
MAHGLDAGRAGMAKLAISDLAAVALTFVIVLSTAEGNFLGESNAR